MADLTWTTSLRAPTYQQDPTPITSVQPDLSPQYNEDELEASAYRYQDYLEKYLKSAVEVLRDKLDALAKLIYNDNGSIQLRSYVKTSMPSASPAGQLIYVTNDVGGPVPAFSDGSNWRRTTDRAVIV